MVPSLIKAFYLYEKPGLRTGRFINNNWVFLQKTFNTYGLLVFDEIVDVMRVSRLVRLKLIILKQAQKEKKQSQEGAGYDQIRFLLNLTKNKQ